MLRVHAACLSSVQREAFVVAAEGLVKEGFKMRVCMPMASAREQRCPRIAANNLVFAFSAAYGRVSLKELVFQNVSKPSFAFEYYPHMCICMAFSPRG